MRAFIKTKKILSPVLCTVLSIPLFLSVAQAEIRESSVGPVEYIGGYPTKETAQKFYDELDLQRAVEVYLWALPMASYGAMADAKNLLNNKLPNFIISWARYCNSIPHEMYCV